MEKKIELGQSVADRVSGFAGIATGRGEFLGANPRVQITSTTVGKEGTPVDHWFDEGRVDVVAQPTTLAPGTI